jgi:hypothetical protein
MSKSSLLNVENLESLGANRLAQLLLEVCNSDPISKRKLRYELIARSGSTEIVKEIRRRIATIARSSSVIEWEDCRSIAEDLLILKNTIVKAIAKDDPPTFQKTI